MPTFEYYRDACRLGQKAYKKRISQGQFPYLPVLDEILQEEETDRGTDIGIRQIPAKWIVGTKTSGRTQSFAVNFMPLMDESTEFAGKWRRLCTAHLEEGIREPIKVYEYMNRYYVEEGNKRTSVLKFFQAVTIPARVIRILPLQTDEPEKEVYFELLDFQKISGINFIEFSVKNRYNELLQICGKNKNDIWTEEERQQFYSNFYIFSHGYESLDSRYRTASVYDAFLAYIKVFGYHTFPETDEATLKNNIKKLTEEITLMADAEPMEINYFPEENKTSLFRQMLNYATPKSNAPLKIAFVHDKTKEISGWTNNHELGRVHVQSLFQNQIETTAYFDAMEAPGTILEQAVNEGHTVIFTTSPRLLQPSLQAAIAHPEVIIYNCSLNKPHRYVRTYYSRMYEAKFITGAIAASLSHGDDRLGYICNYPIYGHIAGINAFALGAQLVNPDIRIYLEWSGVKGIKNAVQDLLEQNINLVSSLESVPLNRKNYNFYGLFQIKDDKKTSLAVPLWQWDIYYEEIIRRILNGSAQEDYEKSRKALNYYWGISAGVVDILCAGFLPESTKKLAYFLKESISRANCRPFMGTIKTQNGTLVETTGQKMTLEEIINMDYLVENVIGSIPAYNQLNEVAKAIVDVVGIDSIIH